MMKVHHAETEIVLTGSVAEMRELRDKLDALIHEAEQHQAAGRSTGHKFIRVAHDPNAHHVIGLAIGHDPS